MPIRHFDTFIITLILIANLTIAEAQPFVGFTGGYSQGRFMDFANDRDYDSNYRLKKQVLHFLHSMKGKMIQ